MKRLTDNSPVNMLKDIHTKLVEFPVEFRARVGEECLWSIPTYYRKMKSGTDILLLSNAEKEKILVVLDEMFLELATYFQKYRKSQ